MTGVRDDEKALFERMVNDAMRVFGFKRTKAEALAKKMVVRIRKANAKKADEAKRRAVASVELTPTVRPPRNAKERLERALGPDPGERRRRGSPVVQGGSPGLGKRR